MNQLHLVDLERPETYLENPYPPHFEKVTVPEGVSGDWSVQRYTVDKDKIGLVNLRLIRDGMMHRIVPPGTYTRLVHKDAGVVMTDTPAEAHEHRRLLQMAKGKILLNGLGLGFALSAILRKPGVEEIVIIEISSDVIKLVAPTYEVDHRVKIIHGDALATRLDRGRKFDVVWHDIWTGICADNKQEMIKLRRSYARRAAWQSCWSEEYL